MATLESVDGRSLVPDLSNPLNLLLQVFGTKQQREDRAEEKRLVNILAGTDPLDQSGTGVPPSVEGETQINREDAAQLLGINAEADKGLQQATTIKNITGENAGDTFQKRQRAIMEMAQETAVSGGDPTRQLELANMTPEKLELELDKMMVAGKDIKTLTAPSLQKPSEDKNKKAALIRLAQLNPQAAKVISTILAKQEQSLASFFGKPQIKDFEPESIKKFFTTRDISDLKAVPKGPNSQILTGLLPFVLGGVDFDNPQEVLKALAKAQAMASALSGQGTGADQLKIPTGPAQAQTEKPEEKGVFEKGVDFVKQTASSLFTKLSEIVSSGTKDKTERNKVLDALIKKGFKMELRKGKVHVNGKPLDKFMEAEGLSVSSELSSESITVPRKQLESQIGTDFSIDEDGFAYIPNPNAKGGKQFIRKGDKKTGPKVRVR